MNKFYEKYGISDEDIDKIFPVTGRSVLMDIVEYAVRKLSETEFPKMLLSSIKSGEVSKTFEQTMFWPLMLGKEIFEPGTRQQSELKFVEMLKSYGAPTSIDQVSLEFLKSKAGDSLFNEIKDKLSKQSNNVTDLLAATAGVNGAISLACIIFVSILGLKMQETKVLSTQSGLSTYKEVSELLGDQLAQIVDLYCQLRAMPVASQLINEAYKKKFQSTNAGGVSPERIKELDEAFWIWIFDSGECKPHINPEKGFRSTNDAIDRGFKPWLLRQEEIESIFKESNGELSSLRPKVRDGRRKHRSIVENTYATLREHLEEKCLSEHRPFPFKTRSKKFN